MIVVVSLGGTFFKAVKISLSEVCHCALGGCRLYFEKCPCYNFEYFNISGLPLRSRSVYPE